MSLGNKVRSYEDVLNLVGLADHPEYYILRKDDGAFAIMGGPNGDTEKTGLLVFDNETEAREFANILTAYCKVTVESMNRSGMFEEAVKLNGICVVRCTKSSLARFNKRPLSVALGTDGETACPSPEAEHAFRYGVSERGRWDDPDKLEICDCGEHYQVVGHNQGYYKEVCLGSKEEVEAFLVGLKT